MIDSIYLCIRFLSLLESKFHDSNDLGLLNHCAQEKKDWKFNNYLLMHKPKENLELHRVYHSIIHNR